MNKVKEIFDAWSIAMNPNTFQAELAAKRLEICNACEHKTTTVGINTCSLCGCALKGKVFSGVKGACPDGRWDEVDHVGTKETIFVQIAAYRDPELLKTLNSLLVAASNPERLKICIAWQHAEEDEWDNLDQYKEDPRFIILDIPYTDSKGACWARNQIQQHYNGEDYTLQLDSHHRFQAEWDYKLVVMLKDLQIKGYPKPLITGYIPSYFPDNDPAGRTNEVWQMNFDRFTPEGYIFTRPGTMENWMDVEKPQRARFYSAHFAFTLGQFCKEVPHDPEMYFHGEEPSISARAYTWGYDLFHPHTIVAWHEYTREGKTKHWDNHTNWPKQDQESYRRYRVLHGQEEGDIDFGPYGFGTERTLQDYEEYAGVRFKDKTVKQETLDFKTPPTSKEGEYISVFRHCIDLHKPQFQETDYDFWCVAFEKFDGTVIKRMDAYPDEIKGLQNIPGDWMQLWREFNGERPDKVVVWAHSESKGWLTRIENEL